MNKTNIIVTITPETNKKEIIKELALNGTNVFRLNLNEHDYSFCEDVISKIDEVNKEINYNVATMLDTRGPIIKTHKFIDGEKELIRNTKIRIYMNKLMGDETKFSVDYKELIDDIQCNNTIKLGNGNIEIRILEKGVDYLLGEVINGGIVKDYMEVHPIDFKISKPFLSKTDKEDIIFADTMNIDFLAISQIRTQEDVLLINDLLIELGNDHIEIISKIESESAVEDMDNILKISEGLMISKEKLRLTVPIERIPGIRRMIVNKCHTEGKVSIIPINIDELIDTNEQTLILEAADVANAVLDGCDAIMIPKMNEENKIMNVLDTIRKTIHASESEIDYLELLNRAKRTDNQDITSSLAYSVTELANRLECKAIVAPTISGYTARKMSRYRPTCPIIAISPNEDTVKSLSLHFGIHPILIKELKSLDDTINKSKEIVSKKLDITNEKIIITGGYPFSKVKHTNFIKIEEL